MKNNEISCFLSAPGFIFNDIDKRGSWKEGIGGKKTTKVKSEPVRWQAAKGRAERGEARAVMEGWCGTGLWALEFSWCWGRLSVFNNDEWIK